MNCLKCDNYWKTDIDELMCEFCPHCKGNQSKEREEKKDG